MSNYEFKVTRIFPGSENQKKVGIHATFSMNIENSDGILITLNDLMLRKNREGQYYIESAFRTYDAKDKSGNPSQKKVNYSKLFPEEKNWSKQDAIVSIVLDALNSGEASKPKANKPAYNKSNNDSPRQNNYQKDAPAKSSSNDPW